MVDIWQSEVFDRRLARVWRQSVEDRRPILAGVFIHAESGGTERLLGILSHEHNNDLGATVFVRGDIGSPMSVRERLNRQLRELGIELERDAGWAELIRAATVRGIQLVFGHADRLSDADRRFVGQLASAWNAPRTEGTPPRRVFLLSDDRRFLNDLAGDSSPFHDPLRALTANGPSDIALHDLGSYSFAALAQSCPSWPAIDVIRGYAVFGGLRGVLQHLDPGRSLSHNVTRLILDPDGALFDLPVRTLGGQFRKSSRYGAVLEALAHGARTWQDVTTNVSGPGSPLGAYVKRLEERGWLEVRSSLDAEEGSRRRRYELVDPFHSFWFRVMPPIVEGLEAGRIAPRDAWSGVVSPQLDDLAGGVFPRVARAFLSHYALERLGSEARVVGGLWGDGYDFDAAATLRDGSVVYGHCTWVDRPIGEGALDRVRNERRETRYGFGRERRTAIVFMKQPASVDLVRATLRDPNSEWIDARQLVQAARSPAPTSP